MTGHPPKQALEEVESPEFDRVWQVMTELAAAERHFNELESRYRALASTWLLATFAGVGFVLSTTLDLPFHQWLAVAALGVAGTIGIVMLWNLDLLAYHQLLDSVFWEAYQLEERYPWVPPVRHSMVERQRASHVLPRVAFFYLATVAVLVFLAATGFAAAAADQGVTAIAAAIAATALPGALLLRYMYLATTGRSESRLWRERDRLDREEGRFSKSLTP